MAVGDDAAAAGFALVPATGQELAKVRYGAQEINRTRDFVAQVKSLVLATWPVSRGGTGATDAATARSNLGINQGTALPNNSDGNPDGTMYFRILT